MVLVWIWDKFPVVLWGVFVVMCRGLKNNKRKCKMCLTIKMFFYAAGGKIVKVFISWSGKNSKIVALALDKALKETFENEKLETFISSGFDWFQNIKRNLEESECAIICCTPDNCLAPWINFEAGASMITFNKVETQVIPYLFGMDEIHKKSPFKNLHYVKHSIEGYQKMINDINGMCNLSDNSRKQLNSMAETAFRTYLDTRKIRGIFNVYKLKRMIEVRDIYPYDSNMLCKKNVFISSPMASMENNEYTDFHNDIILIQKKLKDECKAKNVYYPGKLIDKPEKFDGHQKAVNQNFVKLKECEYLIVVYPKPLPSSVLVEIGYAIALSKKIIIFVKDPNDLPYMLHNSDVSINNIYIMTYKKIDDIIHQIESNGKAFLM